MRNGTTHQIEIEMCILKQVLVGLQAVESNLAVAEQRLRETREFHLRIVRSVAAVIGNLGKLNGIVASEDSVDLLPFLTISRNRRNGLRNQARRVMKMQHGRKCAVCGARATTCHHVLPISRGGGNDIRNLEALCDRCHHAHHAVEHGQSPKSDKGASPTCPSELVSV